MAGTRTTRGPLVSIGGLPGQADADARTEARAEARRHQRVAVAHRGQWDELPRRHLRLERFGIVVDERDDTTYRVHRGEVDQGTPAVAAYYVDESDSPVFLERLPGGPR